MPTFTPGMLIPQNRPLAGIPRVMPTGGVPMHVNAPLAPGPRTNAILGVVGGGDQQNLPHPDYSQMWTRFQNSPWYGWLSQQPWFQTWQAQWRQSHPGVTGGGGGPQPGPPPNQGPDYGHPYSPHPYTHPLLNLLAS